MQTTIDGVRYRLVFSHSNLAATSELRQRLPDGVSRGVHDNRRGGPVLHVNLDGVVTTRAVAATRCLVLRGAPPGDFPVRVAEGTAACSASERRYVKEFGRQASLLRALAALVDAGDGAVAARLLGAYMGTGRRRLEYLGGVPIHHLTGTAEPAGTRMRVERLPDVLYPERWTRWEDPPVPVTHEGGAHAD